MKLLRAEDFDPETGKRLPSLSDNPDNVDPEAAEADRVFGEQLYEEFVAAQIARIRSTYGARYSKLPEPKLSAPEPPPMPSPEMHRPAEPLLGEPRRLGKAPPPVWSSSRGVWTPTWCYKAANAHEQRARERANADLNPQGTDTSEPLDPAKPLPSLR
jgi:hypothetical protein